MVAQGSYMEAYPLHDGFSDIAGNIEKDTQRSYLRESWGRIGASFNFQPLNVVRDYFGEKIGLCPGGCYHSRSLFSAFYFAWLGFFTTWLVTASIIGVAAFLYGAITSNENSVCLSQHLRL